MDSFFLFGVRFVCRTVPDGDESQQDLKIEHDVWVVSRVGHCCSCLPCRQNMKFDLCAINDNKKVTDFAAAPTT